MEQRTDRPWADDCPDERGEPADRTASRTGAGGHPRERRWDARSDDGALLAGMRAGEQLAYSEFVRRWQPLLSDAARRQGVPPGPRDDLVADVLVDAAAAFGSGRPAPRAMAAYLVAALRNRVRNAHRDAARREAREQAAGALASAGEGEVPTWTSPSPAPDAACDPALGELLDPALARLAEALASGLSEDDRLLLVWVGHRVPHRDIAAWLGIGRAAVAKRIERLRVRLRHTALAHLEQADAPSRAALLRFFRRADLAPSSPPSPPPAGTRGSGRPRAGSPTAPQGSEA